MKLKKYLTSQKMTIGQFALKSGISRITIHKYLNGSLPTLINAIRVEDATQGVVTVRDLVKRSEIKKRRIKKTRLTKNHK